jgi:hypothetical protein
VVHLCSLFNYFRKSHFSFQFLFQTLNAVANIKKITLEMYIRVQVDTDMKCLLFQKEQYSEFLSCL